MKNEQVSFFRRAVVKIILIAVFILVAIAVILPLAAEIKFNSAQKLADAYLWEKAEGKFNEAIRIDPFNASHLAGYGDFLELIAPYRDKKTPLLQKAEDLHKRAGELDPMNAEYPLKIGEIKLKLFLIDKEKYKEEPKEALGYFKRALRNDPNSFNVSYEVGYYGLEAWPYLNAEFKKLIVERLRVVLTQRRWYWEHIYPLAWQNINDFGVLEQFTPKNLKANEDLFYFLESNNLYQFHRREAEVVDFYMKKEEPEKFFNQQKEKSERIERFKEEHRNTVKLMEISGNSLSPSDWHGKADDGKNEFKDGNMYWSGTMSAVISVSKGRSMLSIQAKGEPADGIYPYMIVGLDGKEVGETFVANDDWKEYTFPIETNADIKVLSITFCNDSGDAKKHEDRNLYIGDVKIRK